MRKEGVQRKVCMYDMHGWEILYFAWSSVAFTGGLGWHSWCLSFYGEVV